MHKLKKRTSLLLVLTLALMAVPPMLLHSQDRKKPGRIKRAAVLRRESQPATPPTTQEAQFSMPTRAVLTKAFRKGRDLLVKKGLPFEPNILLEGNWYGKLKEALAQVPEFQEVRRGGRKLKGAQIADTLLLPERIELDGDTVIVAKRLIFEGRDAVIKGNHDVHIFTVEPITLTEAVTEGNQAQLLNVGFNASSKLRRLASALRPAESGNITIDPSGAGRKEWLESLRKNRPAVKAQSGARTIKAGFDSGSRSVALQVTEDKSGRLELTALTATMACPETTDSLGPTARTASAGVTLTGTRVMKAAMDSVVMMGKMGWMEMMAITPKTSLSMHDLLLGLL